MTLNSRSRDPQPVQSFYPDPDHLWTGKTPIESTYLLRAASAGSLDNSPEQLLRAAEENEPKRLTD